MVLEAIKMQSTVYSPLDEKDRGEIRKRGR